MLKSQQFHQNCKLPSQIPSMLFTQFQWNDWMWQNFSSPVTKRQLVMGVLERTALQNVSMKIPYAFLKGNESSRTYSIRLHQFSSSACVCRQRFTLMKGQESHPGQFSQLCHGMRKLQRHPEIFFSPCYAVLWGHIAKIWSLWPPNPVLSYKGCRGRIIT